MGYTGVVKIPSSPADFHPSSPCCGAKKRMKMKKKSMDAEGISTTAVRLTLSPSREEE